MNLYEWAARWQIPAVAFAELMGTVYPPGQTAPAKGTSEAATSAAVRLEASRKAVTLWRNNSGVLLDATGRPVRFGLANESKEGNANFKSSDWIGIRPRIIEQAHVGLVLGQFVARECKRADWRGPRAGDAREMAQLNFIRFVSANGGDAAFCTGEGTL